MSATQFRCGCVVSRDAEMQIVSIVPCDRHRWMLQPELDAFYQRLLDLRALETLPPELPEQPPDIEIEVVPETPREAMRGVDRPKGRE